MSSMTAVKCRSCGEINFVQTDRDFVVMSVPVENFDEAVKFLYKHRPQPDRQRRSPVSDEDIAKARALRASGMTIRQICVEMNWSLGATARRLK
jgi:hypothetical protein